MRWRNSDCRRWGEYIFGMFSKIEKIDKQIPRHVKGGERERDAVKDEWGDGERR